jgi:hypothetical protein
MSDAPLRIRFLEDTRLRKEAAFASGLPIVGNGPPGTFVVFPSGLQVPLPTDQIVESHDDGGAVVVGFGGLRFDGLEGGQFVFRRVRELWPDEQLSPERSRKMTLRTELVAAIFVDGELVWPTREQMN